MADANSTAESVDCPTHCPKKMARSRTSEYVAWAGMMKRCYDANYKRFDRYGGRGIVVCEQWRTFENFGNDIFGSSL
jgi:hypothetical protein